MGMGAILVMWLRPFNILSFLHLIKAPNQIWLWLDQWFNKYVEKMFENCLVFFEEKKFEKCWIWVTLDKAQWMTLTFDIHKGSCNHLVDCIYQLYNTSEKSIVLLFSHKKV